jgi:hypothetical protein
MANKTLERDIPLSAKSGQVNDSVLSAIKLVNNARIVRQSEGLEEGWEALVDHYMDQYEVVSRQFRDFSTRSKLLQQVLQSILKRYARPKRKFVGDNVDRDALEIVKDAVNTAQMRGGLKDVMRGNWGTDHKFILLGDSFIQIGAGGSDEQPVKFSAPPITSVYLDIQATTMVTESGENAVGEALVIQDMDYDTAKVEYPDTVFVAGKIPVDEREYLRNNKTDRQQSLERERNVEIGHYYNIKAEEPTYTIFAGSMATIIKEYKGKDYPFFLDGEPFIPLVNFKMFPVPKGFYGRGLHVVYDYSNILEKLRNLALLHVKDNVNPINIINVQGKKESVLNQIFNARELQKQNEKGYVINEINSVGGSTANANITTLRTDVLTAEYERILADLDREMKRLGISLDDVDVPASQTATATVSENVAENEFTRQVQRQNEQAYRYLDLYTMAIMQDQIKEDSKATIITHAELTKGEEVNAPGETPERLKITMGDAVRVMNENKIAVKMNISEVEQLERALPALQGTKAFSELLARKLRLDGLNIQEEDLLPPEQPQEAEAPEVQEPRSMAERIEQLSAVNQ